MKFRHRLALLIFIFNLLLLSTLSVLYYFHSRDLALQHSANAQLVVAREKARDLTRFLREKVKATRFMAHAPPILEALKKSNKQLDAMPETEREMFLTQRNKHWMAASQHDPLIRERLENPVADYLRNQMKLLPGEHGEIFVTDGYGLTVAATTRLTTLIHAHKYWWRAAHARGEGGFFLDDRGFDDSVGDHVLGVVVPVRENGKLIGIFKANLLIQNMLKDMLPGDEKKALGETWFARSGGRVILEQTIPPSQLHPLSSSLPDELIKSLNKPPHEGGRLVENAGKLSLVAYARVAITVDDDRYAFGGETKSVDHILGNQGEAWFVLVFRDLEEILATTWYTTQWLFLMGSVFIILLAATAWALGSKLAAPVSRLSHQARKYNHLPPELDKDDEIALLTQTFDNLAENLERTTTARDTLIQEIQKRREAEDALRQERDLAKLYLDIAGVMLVVLDTEGKISLINRHGCELLGYAREDELLGLDWFKCCVPPDEHGSIREVFDGIMRGRLQHLEYHQNWIIRRDGRPRFMAFHNTLVYDRKGNISGLLASGEDITERIQSEEEIRKLSLAVEQSSGSVVITDIAGNIEYVNAKFVAVTGYAREEVLGRNPRILKSGETPQEEYARLWHTITHGLEWRGEFHNRKKNGELYWESASISPIKDYEGKITHFIALKEDITERKRVEAELARERSHLEETVRHRTEDLRESLRRLEEANQAKSQFLSSISHELRTPLNAILGFTELLREQFFGPLNEKQLNYVHQVENSGRHLLALINDLLDLTRVDTGSMKLERADISVAEIIHGSLDIIRPECEHKKIYPFSQSVENLPRVYADLRKCRQIMLNLLSNACKYTPENGQVEVLARVEDENFLRLEVKDNGMGIEAGEVDKIFSEFYQTAKVQDEHLGGTGIGLALSKRLVELQGGRIGVNSEPGRGSVFWFTLPIFRQGNMEVMFPGSRKHSLYPPDLPTGHRILVVEDNPASLELMKEILGLYQYEVLVARNGMEALETAQRNKPDLIFMDIRMPLMDGMEATRRLRQLPGFTELPIIALTASAGVNSRRRYLEGGCTAHLAKPVQTETVLSILRHYLK